MHYLILIYSVFLLFLTCFAYKRNLGSSVLSVSIVFLLSLSTILSIFYLTIIVKILISLLLLFISATFFYDRMKSGKKINYSHHCLRLMLHLLMIYCLFRQLHTIVLPVQILPIENKKIAIDSLITFYLIVSEYFSLQPPCNTLLISLPYYQVPNSATLEA